MRDPSASFGSLLGRGLRRRCTRCGSAPAFDGWASMPDHCPACGFVFERESGFWVGAMIINTTVSFALLLIVFVTGWVLFWPDVPWTGLLIATLVVAGFTPVLFYPWSKSLWSAIELSYHRLEPEEQRRAAERLEADRRVE
jgi:uncharacterized protein (DUF983 family)